MAGRTRIQKSAAERREQILTAAAEVFAERGFYSARIDDIAASADLSKGTIYWYFPSKDEIVIALVDAFYAEARSSLVDLRDRPGTVVERLRDYLRSYACLLTEQRHMAPLAIEFYALAPRQQRVRELLREYYASWTDAVVTLFDQANQRGELQIDDTSSAARALVELFDGAFLVWTVLPDPVDLNERMQTAFDLLHQGLAGGASAGVSGP